MDYLTIEDYTNRPLSSLVKDDRYKKETMEALATLIGMPADDVASMMRAAGAV